MIISSSIFNFSSLLCFKEPLIFILSIFGYLMLTQFFDVPFTFFKKNSSCVSFLLASISFFFLIF